MEKRKMEWKWMRLFMVALVAVVMAAGFSACGDDDDDTPQIDLSGSFWRGVNPHTGYLTEVLVLSPSRCNVKVYEPDFETLYQDEDCTYTFNQDTGEFRLRFAGDVVAGYIQGDKMVLTDNTYGTFTLYREYID